jgi:branched-chain amino acid transport system ATP-binding protein
MCCSGSDDMVHDGGGALCAHNVTVRFHGITAIDGVSLALAPGDIRGLIGPNGAGKTTLVNVLSGFQAPSQGDITLDDRPARGWPPHQFRRQGIARSFQAGRLFRELTVAEHLIVPAVNLGFSRRRAVAHAREILAWVNLADKTNITAGALVGTDERRLGIARALSAEPRFVLLDEPAAGMSETECEEIIHLITAIPKTFGAGVLLVDHNMAVVMRACDRIHVLDSGRMIAEGAPAEVRSNRAVISAYLGVASVRQRQPGIVDAA